MLLLIATSHESMLRERCSYPHQYRGAGGVPENEIPS